MKLPGFNNALFSCFLTVLMLFSNTLLAQLKGPNAPNDTILKISAPIPQTVPNTGSSLRDTLLANLAARKSQLFVFPFLNYTPETSLAFGLTGLYIFYYDKKDTTIRPSFISGIGVYTLNKQAIFSGYANTWSRQNKFHHVATLSYTLLNNYFYGIGNATLQADKEKLKEDKLELSYIIERKISKMFYGGIEFNYKDDQYTDWAPGGTLDKATKTNKGGVISTLGLSFIFDNRDYFTSATKGHYAKISWLPSVRLLGTQFDFYKLIFESRHFYKLGNKSVLGFNSNYETIQGELPFFELRTMGSAFMMRGYYAGRFREQNYLSGQAEYRYEVFKDASAEWLKRFVLAAFVGGGQVYKNGNFLGDAFKPNFGIGVRYMYDPKSRICFRLDYGWGEKPAGEDRISGLYFFVGEAF